MELARNVWKRSFIVYKSCVQPSLRSSSSETVNVTETPASPRISELQSKIKDKKITNALGATDELSSYIGLAREFANDSKEEHPYVDKLKRVQMILFDLHHTIVKGQVGPFEERHTKDLEEWITEYSEQLPPPEDYIIPGGGKACASLHVAKTVCKRTEHSIEPLVDKGILDKEAQNYLKRLSDFLLTISRIAAKCDKRTENIYIPRAEVLNEKKVS
ncbi:cob(I)yrinic acid a,c-diamide adenosyltransferase, mitochondrial [Copidosoma floridanum]|uniref:cob(I)yrinic acid a,c-diamide adenosyltransferase, mitochondrial n=1 Tax=Copidosoma floridanum TaxID=29053 RepID=UPI0006C9611C|nr:cob(I)yrinic acid a,c-diamide adenosyltransferase, mitochondrial [Copidosoma floridanum]